MFFIRSWLGTIWIYFWIGFGVVATCVFGWFVPQKWVVFFWNRLLLRIALWGLRFSAVLRLKCAAGSILIRSVRFMPASTNRRWKLTQ